MSQRVQIVTKFVALEPLLKAFEVLGWGIQRGVVARGLGKRQASELVAVNPRSDAIGVSDIIIEKKGDLYDVHTTLDSDYANGSLNSLGGRTLEKLKQQFAKQALILYAEQQGDQLEITELENGEIIDVLVTTND